jgi:hypothetical protein
MLHHDEVVGLDAGMVAIEKVVELEPTQPLERFGLTTENT